MYKQIFFVLTLLLSIGLFGQKSTITTEEILVRGNCGMCKDNIENAVKKESSVEGTWNVKTKVLKLSFDAKKTNLDKIMRRVTAAGYDNQLYTADDKDYRNLADCCQYDRVTAWYNIENSEGTHFDGQTEASQEVTTKVSNQVKAITKSSDFKEQILVRGNCSMCKETIETAVSKEATAKGTWNIKTKVLELDFDETKTSLDKIMRRVAAAGYDNQLYTADDKDYNNLPDCCLYDRVTAWDNIENSKGTHVDGETASEQNNVADSNTESEEDEDYSWLNEDAISLANVSAVGNKAATVLDGKSAGLTFNIDSKELLKAACCNLSESFETNATVDVNYANAVTGTKQIKMLGLDQKYTLITKELLPEIRGLASAYGMNFIPGRWVQGIQLTKGGSTVTNGYESISGQINTELFKTHDKNKTSLNFFGDTNSRIEGNIVHADTINGKWAHSFLAHANATIDRQDSNDDGFMDQPIGKQLNASYLLNYNDLDNSGIGTHFGISFIDDHRTAGQVDFVEDYHKLGTEKYGVGIDISRFQVWNKTGYVFKDKPYQSLGWMNQYTYHEQKSFFGTTPYNGIQRSIYSNLIFESILGSTLHKYKAGASFLHDQYDEVYQVNNYKRTETVPGAFFEYTYTGDKLTAVLGSRVDFHNLAGTQFTPRANLKYDLLPKTTLRASAGRGFRTANVFSEAQSFLASNRTVEIIDGGGDIYGLDPEIAWNYGISLHQEFRIFGNKSNIIADYFITDFENQILPDLDQSTQKILFYNMEGKSYARAFQIQWDFEPVKRLEARLAYKNYQTQGDYLSGAKDLPFTPEHRGFMNLAYNTWIKANGSQWSFDTTLQYVGEQRIPNTSTNPVEFQTPDYADSYFLLNAQIARQFNKTLRVYLGAENILGYTQDNPIIDVQNPFGEYFDGGMVWAPIMPGSVYLGLDIEL